MAFIGDTHLDVWDAVVIGIYFIFVLGVGLSCSRSKQNGSVSNYFLASRNMHWVLVGSSLFASNIGSGHFIGLAGSGASSGIGVAGFELYAVFILMMLGWLFVPVYMSAGVYTMPEYLRERFGGQRIRVYLSVLALILYVLTKISADLYAGALFIQVALNRSSTEWLYISILFLLLIAALFTITGGLTAVIWTDFVQTVLMIVGSFILMGIAFSEVGGLDALVDLFPYAVATNRSHPSCGLPPKDYMNLFRSAKPRASDLPWTGMVFGLTINSIWYWCADQVIVQRTLASKNMIHAKAGCVLAAYLKLLPLWILVFPGMISRVLFSDRVACADPDECLAICGSRGGCTNIAYVELVIKLLPVGLSGLMLAVMMAALMSSLTSIFNSASTIFTIDIWTLFRKNATERELLIVGRTFVGVLLIISVIWVPVIQNFGTAKLFDYIQSISSFLAPPICSAFLLGIFWRRTNEPGAFWGLMVGLAIGLLRFAAEFIYTAPKCGSDVVLDPLFETFFFGYMQYLHFSCFSFLITCCTIICISLLTEPLPEDCLHRLLFWNRKSTLVRSDVDEYYKTGKTYYQNYYNSHSQFNMELETNPDVMSQEEKAERAAAFLQEDEKSKWIININAVICLCVAIFVIGFFA